MISLTLATLLSLSAAQGPPMQPRNNFGDCLDRVMKAKMADKMDDATFRAALKAACAAEEAAFKTSLIAWDVKMAMKKAQAEEAAALQIDDYVAGTVETYIAHTKDRPPR